MVKIQNVKKKNHIIFVQYKLGSYKIIEIINKLSRKWNCYFFSQRNNEIHNKIITVSNLHDRSILYAYEGWIRIDPIDSDITGQQ